MRDYKYVRPPVRKKFRRRTNVRDYFDIPVSDPLWKKRMKKRKLIPTRTFDGDLALKRGRRFAGKKKIKMKEKKQKRKDNLNKKYYWLNEAKPPRVTGSLRPYDLGSEIAHAFGPDHIPYPAMKNYTEHDMKNIWHKDHSAVQDSSSYMAAISNFMQGRKGEAFTIRMNLTINGSTLSIADNL